MAEPTEFENVFLGHVRSEDNDLHRSLVLMRNAAEDIWSADAPRIIKDYTDHGIPHCERVTRWASGLLETNERLQLSCRETYLLMAGIYLHDIGMQCDPLKFWNIKEGAEQLGAHFDVEFTARKSSEFSKDEQKAIRDNHHLLTAAWIDHARITGDTALGPAAHKIPDELVGDVIEVCKYHSQLPISECPRYIEHTKQRKRLVAALLRFSDELDIDANRVIIETAENYRLDPENEVYWWLHQKTKVEWIGSALVLSVHLTPRDAEQLGQYIQTLVIDRFREKNWSVRSVLAEHGLSITIHANSGIEVNRYAKSLPSRIVKELESMQQRDSPVPGIRVIAGYPYVQQMSSRPPRSPVAKTVERIVYIDSREPELRKAQEVIVQRVQDLGFEVFTYDQSTSTSETAATDTLAVVDKATIYVGLFGCQDDQTAIAEFHRARESGKSCFVYIPDHGRVERLKRKEIPPTEVETYFSESNVNGGYFNTEVELGLTVTHDISRWLHKSREDLERQKREIEDSYYRLQQDTQRLIP